MNKNRKYTAYLATLIIAAICFAFADFASSDFADLLKAAIWAFVVGNGAEHFAGKMK